MPHYRKRCIYRILVVFHMECLMAGRGTLIPNIFSDAENITIMTSWTKSLLFRHSAMSIEFSSHETCPCAECFYYYLKPLYNNLYVLSDRLECGSRHGILWNTKKCNTLAKNIRLNITRLEKNLPNIVIGKKCQQLSFAHAWIIRSL